MSEPITYTCSSPQITSLRQVIDVLEEELPGYTYVETDGVCIVNNNHNQVGTIIVNADSPLLTLENTDASEECAGLIALKLMRRLQASVSVNDHPLTEAELMEINGIPNAEEIKRDSMADKWTVITTFVVLIVWLLFEINNTWHVLARLYK